MAKKGAKNEKGELQPIIVVKKVKKVAGGHHGGAWKVAYADFVTAMMAFFLLLWLLNVTTSEQRDAIANFFDPTHPQISDTRSGAGGVMGGTSLSTEGGMTSAMQEISLPKQSGQEIKNRDVGDDGGKVKDLKSAKAEELKEELRNREEERFHEAKTKLQKEIDKTPELAELKKHLLIDVTDEGLRIQIVDQEGEPMFPSGSAQMYDKTRRLITLAADVIKKMPNGVSIRGHTDSYRYKDGADYTNWELSADRANATRRVLKSAGIAESRLSNVMGKADTEHLVKDKPLDAKNRRITIIMERESMETMLAREGADVAREIGAPEAVEAARESLEQEKKEPDNGYRRTKGDVYFP
ncbi:MAG: flagellar motor protein MotB [Micavibrio aeruginosavorus]|nr:flagellar motor protein MotB [Micavibrio aeruginosavorus]